MAVRPILEQIHYPRKPNMQQVYPPSLFASNRRFSDSFLALAIPPAIGTLERINTRFGVDYVLKRIALRSRRSNAPCVEYTYYENQAVFNQEGATLPALFNPAFALDKNQPLSAVLACLQKAYGHLSPPAKDAVIAALANTVFLGDVLKLTAPLDLDPLALLRGKDPASFSLEFLIAAQTLHDTARRTLRKPGHCRPGAPPRHSVLEARSLRIASAAGP